MPLYAFGGLTAVEAASDWGAAAVVSILAPGSPTPTLKRTVPHLRLTVHDVDANIPGKLAFQALHLALLRRFLQGSPSRILVHCVLGWSRSPAILLVSAMVHGISASAAVNALRRVAPDCRPNRRILKVADRRGCLGLADAASRVFDYGAQRPTHARPLTEIRI